MAAQDYPIDRLAGRSVSATSLFGTPLVDVAFDRGAMLLTNRLSLPPFPRSLLERLDWWSSRTPETSFLVERAGAGWRGLNYREVRARVDDLASALPSLGLGAEQPLLLLAPNSIEHALVVLACMRIGIPVAVVSPALVENASSMERFARVVATTAPGAAYVGAGLNVNIVFLGLGQLAIPVLRETANDARVSAIAELPRVEAEAVTSMAAKVSPDAPAKILFTSGSTGAAKGVIITQRMMCSNAAGLAVVWPVLLQSAPVLVDWLPWSHIFGGNCCFNLALYYGGTFHIDDGRPTPTAIGRTVENLRLVTPNLYFNVPLGYEALLSHLEEDPSLAQRFFSSAKFLFNAAAALPSTTRMRLDALARKTLGRELPIIGAWGSTETAPFSTVVFFDTPYADNLGIPMPGTTIKMVPFEDRAELRVKGPNVMPGYWRDPEHSREAFDEDGFYRIGDAGQLADPKNPGAGIRFCGRIGENFKLTSGTWVNVGVLRLELIDATKPYVSDIVITGHGRDELGALIFPAIEACRQLLGAGEAELDDHALVRHPAVVAVIRQGLSTHRRQQRGSSTRIERFAVMHVPPSRIDSEITEKGSLNQAAVLAARRSEVDALHQWGHRVCDGHSVAES